MSYNAQVLEDSISPVGVRLTTLEVTFPRFILAEFNTHRVFERNSASSRAIPPEKHIERVEENPFVPETFNKRVKGMGVGDEFDWDQTAAAQRSWLRARDEAVAEANFLNDLGLDKSRVNRLLEPFMWHTVIVTATEWDNFYNLRCAPDAQPEMQKTAKLMREVHAASEPKFVNYGQWHLPLVTTDERLKLSVPIVKKLSTSRCARVSFDKQHDDEPNETTLGRHDRLLESGHLSPFGHPATPAAPKFAGDEPEFYGPFRGWYQYRKQIPNEENFKEKSWLDGV